MPVGLLSIIIEIFRIIFQPLQGSAGIVSQIGLGCLISNSYLVTSHNYVSFDAI
jgi:hypothetical protein